MTEASTQTNILKPRNCVPTICLSIRVVLFLKKMPQLLLTVIFLGIPSNVTIITIPSSLISFSFSLRHPANKCVCVGLVINIFHRRLYESPSRSVSVFLRKSKATRILPGVSRPPPPSGSAQRWTDKSKAICPLNFFRVRGIKQQDQTLLWTCVAGAHRNIQEWNQITPKFHNVIYSRWLNNF